MLHDEEMAVDSGRYATNSQSIHFGPWYISYDVSCILPSVCSTKVVCERDDDQFCQFCVYCKELEIPHFPDMVFPKNILTLTHTNGAKISFNPLDALKRVANTVKAIEVSCSEAWFEARPDAERKKKPFDWTFSTDYQGTLSNDIVVEDTDETISFDLLKRRDQILFYHDLTLFEDELHDHGISKLSVKIRVMPTYWYILLRHFLRVDDVLVRSNETRLFHMLNTDYIIKEYTAKESKAQDLHKAHHLPRWVLIPLVKSGLLSITFTMTAQSLASDYPVWDKVVMMPTSQMKEADDVIPYLSVKEKSTQKLIVSPQSNP